jgi:hypothetical protein
MAVYEKNSEGKMVFTNPVNLEHYSATIATGKHESRSDKYAFVSTKDIADLLSNHGWFPSKVSQVNARVHEGYQRHTVTFRQVNGESVTLKETVFPQIVVDNSHDGLSAITMSWGLYRLVCTNGLVTSEDAMSFKYCHKGSIATFVNETVLGLVDTLPLLTEKVKKYQSIELTDGEKVEYAQAAALLKYDTEKLAEKNQSINYGSLLHPVRATDNGNSLWTTYNIIQEKLIKGNGRYIREGSFYTRKARKISSIKEDLRVNRGLWVLTDEVARSKGVGA